MGLVCVSVVSDKFVGMNDYLLHLNQLLSKALVTADIQLFTVMLNWLFQRELRPRNAHVAAGSGFVVQLQYVIVNVKSTV